jgi:hypothetical protein
MMSENSDASQPWPPTTSSFTSPNPFLPVFDLLAAGGDRPHTLPPAAMPIRIP